VKKVCYKVFLCENCQRQSWKTFISLSIYAKMIGGRSFSQAAPTVWNDLPQHVISDLSDQVTTANTMTSYVRPLSRRTQKSEPSMPMMESKIIFVAWLER